MKTNFNLRNIWSKVKEVGSLSTKDSKHQGDICGLQTEAGTQEVFLLLIEAYSDYERISNDKKSIYSSNNITSALKKESIQRYFQKSITDNIRAIIQAENNLKDFFERNPNIDPLDVYTKLVQNFPNLRAEDENKVILGKIIKFRDDIRGTNDRLDVSLSPEEDKEFRKLTKYSYFTEIMRKLNVRRLFDGWLPR